MATSATVSLMSHGREYIEFYLERGSKTHTGADAGNTLQAFHPRMFATGTNQCPVTLFKKSLEKGPPVHALLILRCIFVLPQANRQHLV